MAYCTLYSLCLTALQILNCECSHELCRTFLSTGCPVFDAFLRGKKHFCCTHLCHCPLLLLHSEAQMSPKYVQCCVYLVVNLSSAGSHLPFPLAVFVPNLNCIASPVKK